MSLESFLWNGLIALIILLAIIIPFGGTSQRNFLRGSRNEML